MANINVNLNQFAISNLNSKLADIVEMTGEYTKTEIINSGKVPRDTGALVNSANVVADKVNNKVTISFSTPYARRLYFHPEYNFQGTGEGLWMDDYVNGTKNQFVINTFKTLCSRYL